jgi:hypothetical protein
LPRFRRHRWRIRTSTIKGRRGEGLLAQFSNNIPRSADAGQDITGEITLAWSWLSSEAEPLVLDLAVHLHPLSGTQQIDRRLRRISSSKRGIPLNDNQKRQMRKPVSILNSAFSAAFSACV